MPHCTESRAIADAPDLVNPSHQGIAHRRSDLSIFATRHAQILEHFNARHQTQALHVITADSLDGFVEGDGREFSKLKYGDPDSIAMFAARIAEQIWEQHSEGLKFDPSRYCVLAPAYRKNPTAAVLLAEKVAEHLQTEYHVPIDQFEMSRRVLAAGDYGVLKTREAREALILNNFTYKGPSIAGRTIFFVEDALVSGTHYQETQRALMADAGVDLRRLHAHFIVDVRPETFAEQTYSVEDVLNHVWIDRNKVSRLVEILEKPEMRSTPRVLKMLLSEPWVQVSASLDELSVKSVLSIQYASVLEELNRKPEYEANAKRLERYASKRLRDYKTNLGLNAVYTLNEKKCEQFAAEPKMAHPRFDRQVTRAEAFSLFKFGDPYALDHFAERMAKCIRRSLGPLIEATPGTWAIAAPTYANAPGSAKLLADRVAQILKIPVTTVDRKDLSEDSFGAIGDARVRFNAAGKAEYDISGAKTKNVVLIEDASMSGANSDRLAQVLRAGGRSVHSWALINIASTELRLEEKLITAAISEPVPVFLTKMLSAPDTRLVMRTMKTLFALPESDAGKVAMDIPLPRAIEVLNLVRANNFDESAVYRPAFQAFAKAVNHRIRAEKGGDLPPYEALTVLDEQNAEQVLASFGPRYSALKYGDPAAVEAAVTDFVHAIRARYGESLEKHPEEWALASTHYFRVDNAASCIGKRVARELGLDYVDVRRKQIYEGEFGAIETRAERSAVVGGNAYVTNPGCAQGRKVLYLDDAVVSGSHLAEHFRALSDAGAAAVEAFALVDVASPRLSLEKMLNYSKVKAGEAEHLVTILSDPEAPLLTRTMKLLLKLKPEAFSAAVDKLPAERVFELLEGAALEGYDKTPSMSANFAQLKEEALRRHIRAMVPECELPEREYRMMLFDYDDTLAPTLTKLSEEMMEELVFFLKRGTHIGLVTMQPIGERGIEDFTMQPLREYLAARGEDPSLLTRLHLIPSEGVVAYRIGKNGERCEAPAYDVGLSSRDRERMQQLVQESEAWKLRTKEFFRGEYISLHFKSREDLEFARNNLRESLAEMDGRVQVVEKKAEGNKQVLHIKSSIASKALGRDYMLHAAADEIERETGRKLERGETLVAGDKMGVSEGENIDTEMFIHGGVNLALGREAVDGAYRGTLHGKDKALLEFLRDARQACEERDRMTRAAA